MYTPFLFDTSEQGLHFVLLHKKTIEAFPMHWHEEIEIAYAEEGETTLFLNGETVTIHPGEAVFINSGDCHYFLPSKSLLTSIIFSPDILGSENLVSGIRKRLDENSRTSASWSAEDKAALQSILGELVAADRESFEYELIVRSALCRLVALAADPKHREASGPERKSESAKVRERIGNVFRYVEEHYSEPISLPAAAAASGYVPTYFSRVFKSCTGMTFYDYLTVFRIRKAEVRLLNTNDSISSIADASGFSSVKTFDRVFKDLTGSSPLKFRKMHTAPKTGRKPGKDRDQSR